MRILSWVEEGGLPKLLVSMKNITLSSLPTLTLWFNVDRVYFEVDDGSLSSS